MRTHTQPPRCDTSAAAPLLIVPIVVLQAQTHLEAEREASRRAQSEAEREQREAMDAVAARENQAAALGRALSDGSRKVRAA